MFSNYSNFVSGVDTAFVVILSIVIFFMVGLTAALIYFIFRYRASKNPVATQIHGNDKLEVIWTAIPLLIVIGMFYYGWTGYKPMKDTPPKNALQIKTTARIWSWLFEYPNGKMMDTLYVPAGKPVNLDLVSADYIHSLYIPAFRIKQDVVPGNKNNAWFIANSPGIYDVFCTEYCGQLHSKMLTAVKVLPVDEFDKWLGDTTVVADAGPSIHPGLKIIKQQGCNACHTDNGTRLVGPSYKGIYGKEEVVLEGKNEVNIVVDDEYIKKSIYEPDAQIVKGYNKGQMLSYKGKLDDKDIELIIDYIKTLK